jgi:hypothetical protein
MEALALSTLQYYYMYKQKLLSPSWKTYFSYYNVFFKKKIFFYLFTASWLQAMPTRYEYLKPAIRTYVHCTYLVTYDNDNNIVGKCSYPSSREGCLKRNSYVFYFECFTYSLMVYALNSLSYKNSHSIRILSVNHSNKNVLLLPEES